MQRSVRQRWDELPIGTIIGRPTTSGICWEKTGKTTFRKVRNEWGVAVNSYEKTLRSNDFTDSSFQVEGESAPVEQVLNPDLVKDVLKAAAKNAKVKYGMCDEIDAVLDSVLDSLGLKDKFVAKIGAKFSTKDWDSLPLGTTFTTENSNSLRVKTSKGGYVNLTDGDSYDLTCLSPDKNLYTITALLKMEVSS